MQARQAAHRARSKFANAQDPAQVKRQAKLLQQGKSHLIWCALLSAPQAGGCSLIQASSLPTAALELGSQPSDICHAASVSVHVLGFNQASSSILWRGISGDFWAKFAQEARHKHKPLPNVSDCCRAICSADKRLKALQVNDMAYGVTHTVQPEPQGPSPTGAHCRKSLGPGVCTEAAVYQPDITEKRK